MADEITIGSKAIKEVQDLRAELIKLSQEALNAGKNLSSISTPGMLNKSSGDNAKASADLDTFKTKYITLSETIQKNAEKSRLAEIRLQQQREKAFDSFDRNAKKEQAQLEKTNSVYSKTQSQINNITKSYNELAVRKERYNNLSTFEETRLSTLQRVTEKYNGTLKNVDAQIGKNQRNVGNYASGYNALGNSINQLTREAPAFANSIQTGFMAVSNNFAALQDSIKGIIAQNRILASEGKPTVSVFKQLAAGVFSWTTLISIAVTLLTVYGAKLVELISGNKDAANSTKALANAQKEANEGSVKEISHLETLRAKVTSVNAPMSERLKIVKELQYQYPSYFGNMTTEQILANKTSGAYEQLTKDILASAKARAISAEIEKIAVKQLELETEISLNKSGKRNLKNALNLNILEQLKDVAGGGGGNNTLKKIIADQEKDLLELNKAQQALIDKYVLIDTGKLGEDGKDNKIKKEKTAKVKKEQREDIEGLKSHLKEVGFLKDEIDSEISRLTTDKITGDAEALPAINFQLEMLIKLRKQLDGLPEADIKIVNNVKTTTKAIRELSEETKRYLKSFIDDFSSNAGLKNVISSFDTNDPNSLFSKIKDGLAFTKENWQATTVDIMESAQEMYNFISNNSKSNFEAEKERLKSQYDVSLAFAGDNAEAKKKLAEDLEKKQKDIANREAKAKKQQAIFNIAIDTAQAVVSALPNFVLAGIVAAFGVAQALVVSSQEIPQYFKGGTHDGGFMMVNDAPGNNFKETIVYPNGGISQPEGRNVIMDAPAGTKIYTPDQWDKIEQERQLFNMLQPRGISMNYVNNASRFDYSAMDGIMNKYLGNITVEKTVIDKRGFGNYVEKQGSVTKINRNFASSKGIRFK